MKTSPQVYEREVWRRQQEFNDLCKCNTQQTQQDLQNNVCVFENVIPPNDTKFFWETEMAIHNKGGTTHLQSIGAFQKTWQRVKF